MPALTDGQIKRAMKRVAASKKPETLTDGEGRGTGRLVLILKPQPTRVTSSFFAQQWSDGKRKLKKIGDYPRSEEQHRLNSSHNLTSRMPSSA